MTRVINERGGDVVCRKDMATGRVMDGWVVGWMGVEVFVHR